MHAESRSTNYVFMTMASESELVIPRKLWENPAPQESEMYRFLKEAERKFGNGPFSGSQSRITDLLIDILGDQFGQQVHAALTPKGRRGDDKITFQYTP